MTKWQRYIAVATALAVSAVVLTATSAGPAIAQGVLKPVEAVIVNSLSNPVPVQTVGSTATSDTRIVNTSSNPVPVETVGSTPISNGGSASFSATCGSVGSPGGEAPIASALAIHMDVGVNRLDLRRNVDLAARFQGPAGHGNSSVVLALTRPIEFDQIVCDGTGAWSVSWVGNEP